MLWQNFLIFFVPFGLSVSASECHCHWKNKTKKKKVFVDYKTRIVGSCYSYGCLVVKESFVCVSLNGLIIIIIIIIRRRRM